MSDIENMMDKINKNIKETLEKIEKKCIELESEFKKNNELLLREGKDLLLQYKVTYKVDSLV